MPVTRKIRLLLAIDSIGEDAGTEKQLAGMIERIDGDRFEMDLCCLAGSARLDRLARYCRARVFPVVRAYSPNGVRQILRLRRYIQEREIDVVHAFTPKATIVTVLAAKGASPRAVVASRRNLGYWYTPRYVRLFRYLNRHTTRVLANSEAVKRCVVEIERIPPGRVDVLYNGVELAEHATADPSAAAALGIPEKVKVAGMVANLRPVKDHELFLRAAALVSRQVPESAFLLVGQGPLRDRLASLAAELGLAEKVFFTDGKGRVPDYLHCMCVGCLSSQSEGFSNAILEYMAAGLPVVATDVGGVAEAVEHGKTGYLVASRDPADFAAPLIELLQDDQRRQAMGRCGVERCRARFSMEAAVQRHEDYYAALAGVL